MRSVELSDTSVSLASTTRRGMNWLDRSTGRNRGSTPREGPALEARPGASHAEKETAKIRAPDRRCRAVIDLHCASRPRAPRRNWRGPVAGIGPPRGWPGASAGSTLVRRLEALEQCLDFTDQVQ